MIRLLILIFFFFSSCLNEKKKGDNLTIIPKPQKMILESGVFSLNNNTGIKFDSLFINELNFLKNIISLDLTGSKNYIVLKQNIFLEDEEYYLNISKNTITIEASNGKGCMHAIQSLRQLFPINYKKNTENLEIQCLEIHDFPRFKWRGMLLDCCRHFMDKDFIKRYIDLLAFHKMNILHLHLTEDQGWRIAIEKYPKLTDIGAWRINKNGEKYGGFYSKDDLIEIIEYAKKQHIEIIPEIELPGHSVAAIASYPYLSCTGDSLEVENDWGVFKDIYCAGNDSVYTFLENVLTEVMEIFPSQYIHIGGDEAPKYRWRECIKCQKRISEEKLKDEHELQSYFIKRIEKFISKNGKRIIGWDEIIEGGIAPSATIQSWRGIDGGILAAQKNHDAIMSPTSHCYFDYDLQAINLEKVYSFEPIPKGLTEKESKHIIGGECNMWSEHAPQESIDSKVFPRILAMAEVLWSKNNKDFKDFQSRVRNHYPKLDLFGVKYGYEKTPIDYDIKIINNNFRVEIFKSYKKMDLKYKIDDNNWQKYTRPIIINKSAIINVKEVNSIRDNPASKEIKLNKHLALGKKINYLTAYEKNYPAKGNNSLSNGIFGDLSNFRDGQWQGFFAKDVEVIIDLEEEIEFSEIKTSFFQYNLSWIIIPKKIEIMISSNGKDFIIYDQKNFNSNPMQEGKFKKEFKFNKKQSARFIKLIAKNFGKLPEKHPAAGSNCWIFIDEIIIK